MSHQIINFFFQQKTSTGEFVFLEDTSSNGTFINGEKVGKFSDLILHHRHSLMELNG